MSRRADGGGTAARVCGGTLGTTTGPRAAGFAALDGSSGRVVRLQVEGVSISATARVTRHSPQHHRPVALGTRAASRLAPWQGAIIRPSPISLAPGSTLGPYAIVAELGHGGMGVVYTVQDPRLKRRVAIKLLPPDLTRDETAKQRFLQEARAASALDHPEHLHDQRDQRDRRRADLSRDGPLRRRDA